MSSTIHIVQGNHITNIGNAFLDLGSEASLRAASSSAQIVKSSSFPAWYFHTQLKSGFLSRKRESNFFFLTPLLKADFAVFSGMVITEGFVDRYAAIIRIMRENNVKIVLNGAGPVRYTPEETAACRAFWADVGLYCLVSRDRPTYDAYGDIAEHAYDGIDCGFFLSDLVGPVELEQGKFDIHAFDGIAEPEGLPTKNTVVRPHHRLYPTLGLKDRNALTKENAFISEDVLDYLTLYSNANTVYSDRVHACVAAVSYGKPFRLYTKSDRAWLFEKVGVSREQLKDDVVKVDPERLDAAKKAQIEFLRNVLSSG